MDLSEKAEITRLLNEIAGGHDASQTRLFSLVYNKLHKIALRHMHRERIGHTMQATALAHEAYIRLTNECDRDWKNRAHFFAVAAAAMRAILVDYARTRKAAKRGGNIRRVGIEEVVLLSKEQTDEVLAVHEALDRLAALDPRQAKVIEMRYFAGLTEEEIALVLGVSSRTVKRDWTVARAWLRMELAGSRQ